MITKLHKIKQIEPKQNIAFLINSQKELKQLKLEKEELQYLEKKYPKDEAEIFKFNRYDYWIIVCAIPEKTKEEEYAIKELYRNQGYKLYTFLKGKKENEINIIAESIKKQYVLAFIEGILLSSYSFGKYKDKKNKQHFISKINCLHKDVSPADLTEVINLSESVFLCRDLVNEPGSSLTAAKFAEIVKEESSKAKIKTETFEETRIRTLKMNGLLAVNQGSKNEPSFTVLEWKPKGAINTKPYVLVGKGVMFDSGGLSLKPPNAMEAMKSDMAGAAAVFSAIRAIALNNLNVHVIGLLPATDNMIINDAIAPGDIISMMNGKTVEVLNTDAEGRLILADALCYAEKFKPELVIDIATLTGSASMAIGKYGIVGMHDNSSKQMESLVKSGYNVYERIVEFPMWKEYDKEIESNIADIKNIGNGREAGAITAGCFLKNFISYPWIHLDIAGMGFMDKNEKYISQGGSGVGVRLLYDFLKHKINTKD